MRERIIAKLEKVQKVILYTLTSMWETFQMLHEANKEHIAYFLWVNCALGVSFFEILMYFNATVLADIGFACVNLIESPQLRVAGQIFFLRLWTRSYVGYLEACGRFLTLLVEHVCSIRYVKGLFAAKASFTAVVFAYETTILSQSVTAVFEAFESVNDLVSSWRNPPLSDPEIAKFKACMHNEVRLSHDAEDIKQLLKACRAKSSGGK